MRLPQKTRDALKERAEGRCDLCALPGTNAHHRKNRSQMGRNDLSNLMWLCGTGTTGCHGWVTEHPAEAYSEGWSVPSFRNPQTTPVRRLAGWALLADDGSIYEIPTPAGDRVA